MLLQKRGGLNHTTAVGSCEPQHIKRHALKHAYEECTTVFTIAGGIRCLHLQHHVIEGIQSFGFCHIAVNWLKVTQSAFIDTGGTPNMDWLKVTQSAFIDTGGTPNMDRTPHHVTHEKPMQMLPHKRTLECTAICTAKHAYAVSCHVPSQYLQLRESPDGPETLNSYPSGLFGQAPNLKKKSFIFPILEAPHNIITAAQRAPAQEWDQQNCCHRTGTLPLELQWGMGVTAATHGQKEKRCTKSIQGSVRPAKVL